MSSRLNLPFLLVIVLLAGATLWAAAVQLSERVPLSPWEPAIAMEAMRLNSGLPVYESAHATHLYGPLLTVFLGGVFKIFGLNLIAARVGMSIFAFGLAIFLSAILCDRKTRVCFSLAVLLFLGINLRTNMIVFSTQPDWAAAFLAVAGLFCWIRQQKSVVAIALFIGAMLFKQTAAAFALIPIVHALLCTRPLQLRAIARSVIPTLSILLALAVIRVLSPQMFAAMVTIPGSIKVYPERLVSVTVYLFFTFPIALVALWSILRSRNQITQNERWILSALIVLIPVSIWTMCKSGSGYNSLLYAYLAMTALLVARLGAIFDWLRSLSLRRGFVAAIVLALAILASFFLQLDRSIALLSVRHGDDRYDAAVSIARGLNGIVIAPQDPTIPYRAKGYFGRSLFFELDTHAVNGNWPAELPISVLRELQQANYVIAVRSYVPTPMFERSLAQNGFQQVSFSELQDSAYTVWNKTSE